MGDPTRPDLLLPFPRRFPAFTVRIPQVLVVVLPDHVAVEFARLNGLCPIRLPGLHRATVIAVAVLLDRRLVDTFVLNLDVEARAPRPLGRRVALDQWRRREQRGNGRNDLGFHWPISLLWREEGADTRARVPARC